MERKTLTSHEILEPEDIEHGLFAWAKEKSLPYGLHKEDFIDRLNLSTMEFVGEQVALSHFYAFGGDVDMRKFEFSKEDVVQGIYNRFEIVNDHVRVPVGISMNINLVPGSSPGIHRDESVPLWNEETSSLKLPNFEYQRNSGSLWGKILQGKIRSRF